MGEATTPATPAAATTNSYNHSSNFFIEVQKSVAHMSQKLHSSVRLTRRMSDASDCDFPKWKSSKTRARTLWSNLRGSKKLRRFPERKAKIKAICRFAVMPICRGGQLLFCSTRIRKGQAKLLLLLLQLVHLVTKSMSRCLSPSLSLSRFSIVFDSVRLHLRRALCALFALFTLFIGQFSRLLPSCSAH